MKEGLYNHWLIFLRTTAQAWWFLVDLIFPVNCLGCNQEGAWLCEACLAELRLEAELACVRCKKPDRFGRTCPDCLNVIQLDGVVAAASYAQPLLEQAIKTFKYKFAKSIGQDLASIMIKRLNIFLIDQASADRPAMFDKTAEILVMPVPLHPKRQRWRGFNQAEVIARRLADYFRMELEIKNLIRIKNNQPQVSFNGQERLVNIKDCFALQASSSVKGRKIILIDDVITTGATLNECAKILKLAGASQVWAMVVAKG